MTQAYWPSAAPLMKILATFLAALSKIDNDGTILQLNQLANQVDVTYAYLDLSVMAHRWIK